MNKDSKDLLAGGLLLLAFGIIGSLILQDGGPLVLFGVLGLALLDCGVLALDDKTWLIKSLFLIPLSLPWFVLGLMFTRTPDAPASLFFFLLGGMLLICSAVSYLRRNKSEEKNTTPNPNGG